MEKSPLFSDLLLYVLSVSTLVNTTRALGKGLPSRVTLPSTGAPTVCACAGKNAAALNTAASASKIAFLFMCRCLQMPWDGADHKKAPPLFEHLWNKQI